MIFVALLLMGIFASMASLFLKKATIRGLNIQKLVFNLNLYIGGGLYVLSALLNLYLLKQLPYSVVVPLGSLTYIWTLFISSKFLGEKITKRKVIGIIFLLVGVTLVAVE